ncbi:MAG: hypothetical protein OQK57_02935 [Ignavibacteriaceae bacterium]|nr:hypothetical protein [Ignavibacteriaceae bacterium]
MIDKVIKAAYGDAGIGDRIYIHWRVAKNREIKELLEEYKQTAMAVKNVKREAVPDYIIEAVKNYKIGKKQSESFASRFSNAFFMLFVKRAIPATVLGIILVLIVSFLVFREPASLHKYSRAEIVLAEKQFRQSMAIVGEAFQNAEKSFSDEVINKQVNKNLNRGYYLVNNILTGG